MHRVASRYGWEAACELCDDEFVDWEVDFLREALSLLADLDVGLERVRGHEFLAAFLGVSRRGR